MGVCGAGKSAIGAELAKRRGATFVDSDSLHPPTNVAKMAAGTSLTDDDRWPWLELVGAAMASSHPNGIIVACSALNEPTGTRSGQRHPQPCSFNSTSHGPFCKARGESTRAFHAPPSLLNSQLETLEPLDVNEAGLTVVTQEGIAVTANDIIRQLCR